MIHQHPVSYKQMAWTVAYCFIIVGVVGASYIAAWVALRLHAGRSKRKGK